MLNYKGWSAALLLLSALPCFSADIDLRSAVIHPTLDLSGPHRKAVDMLIEEIEKRTRIRLPLATTTPPANTPTIRITRRQGPAEGYRIAFSNPSTVTVEGNDARGVLFGIGHLMRAMRLDKDRITLDSSFHIETAPKYPLRGHQLGYRPKTNAYDAWSLPMWEQYLRDLAVFGANSIELIPPRSDDDADSPHFPKPPMEMMTGMSKLAADYGLDVWIWYPAMDKDYSNPATVEFALKEWAAVFEKLPRVDAVFVPGGDPGHTQPKYLMALLEKQTANLRKYHPKATMRVAPQGFSKEWMDEFLSLVKQEPAWLTGIVFGPQNRLTLADLRAAIPKRYPIRHYPDITHTVRSQYPVPDWDPAFAITEGREPVNPRPIDQAAIFRLLQPLTNGFITYSEGCNDDVNKFVWSALGWNPDQPVLDILREFSGYFIADRFREGFAQGLLALERNWRGSLLANDRVYTTLSQFQEMERAATPQIKLNWRFQQGLYRAYYDAFLRARLIRENAAEESALESLRQASRTGALPAIDQAAHALHAVLAESPASEWRARVFALAEALYQSIHMQLSVDKYQAIAVGRGANLDAIDTPLNNRHWLNQRFASIRQMSSESDRRRAIDEILNWTNPGPGGYYDDLGNPGRQSHLVRPFPYAQDPEAQKSPFTGFAINPDTQIAPWRTSWIQHAETRNDTPLEMRYSALDPLSRYKIKIVYAGENLPHPIRLSANGIEIHPFRQKDRPVVPVEFPIPPQAISPNGELTLHWEKPAGLGGNGRGLQIAEVWLIREPR